MTTKTEPSRCLECDQPAAWIRHTQFAGSHPFCEVHAHNEPDFGKEDSYELWESIADRCLAEKAVIEEAEGEMDRLGEVIAKRRIQLQRACPHPESHAKFEDDYFPGGYLDKEYWVTKKLCGICGMNLGHVKKTMGGYG